MKHTSSPPPRNITFREEPEWTEPLTERANQVIGNSTESISKAVENLNVSEYLYDQSHFGNAGKQIAEILVSS
jgi:hypothetical protein